MDVDDDRCSSYRGGRGAEAAATMARGYAGKKRPCSCLPHQSSGGRGPLLALWMFTNELVGGRSAEGVALVAASEEGPGPVELARFGLLQKRFC